MQRAFERGGRAAADLAEMEHDELEAEIIAQHASPANLAAYLGYAALYDQDTGVCLIVNRTAIRVQREDIR